MKKRKQTRFFGLAKVQNKNNGKKIMEKKKKNFQSNNKINIINLKMRWRSLYTIKFSIGFEIICQ